jgi:mRNA interferase MazF
MSNDTANALLHRVQVVPLSSQTERLYPSETYVTLDSRRRKAMADQLTTLSKRRLLRRMGVISPEEMDAVGRVIRLHLHV